MTGPLAAVADPAAAARAAAGAGRLEEARRHFANAMAHRPGDAMLMVEAAVVEGQSGNLKTTERLLEKALRIDPENVDAWYNLGQAARQRDQLERAVRLFRKALLLEAKFPDAAFGLGEALYVQGKAEEALPWLEEAARLAPEDAEVVHVKALALDHLGRSAEALECYREVLRLQPGHVNGKLNLAVLAARAADPLESLALLAEVEATAEMPPAGHAIAAQVLHLAGEDERALAHVDRALAAGVNDTAALLTRCDILRDAGDFDAAEAGLHKVLATRRDDAAAYYGLSVIKRLPPTAERPLLRMLRDDTASVSTRGGAGFALYRLYAQAGDDQRAFEMLNRANALYRGKAPFDVARHEAECDRVAAAYSPQLIAQHRAHGFDRSGPVFIVGMPRSGTTLTEQILAAHPEVMALGERLDVRRAVVGKGWPEAAADFDATTLHDQGRQVHDGMFANAMFDKVGGCTIATDKSPGNYMLAGAIACMLPRAKLVYVRRTPGDNALSLFEQSFLRGINYSYELGHIGAVYRAHVQLMKHWTETCGLAVHTVEYDLLVQDPEPHVRRLLDFVGLDFRPECLAPHRAEGRVRTSSVWQVRQPINAGSVGRWRRYEQQLQPFFKALEGI